MTSLDQARSLQVIDNSEHTDAAAAAGTDAKTPRPPSARTGDALGRLRTSECKGGRGSVVGWTSCPLCGSFSSKKFALGRGIATHLQTVHAPWNPGKAELRKRRRLAEQAQQQEQARAAKKRKLQTTSGSQESNQPSLVPLERSRGTGKRNNSTKNDDPNNSVTSYPTERWTPTEEEIRKWDEKVLQIVTELEESHRQAELNPTSKTHSSSSGNPTKTNTGVDRNGKPTQTYRNSLPPFLKAAAEGQFDVLKSMIEHARQQGKSSGDATNLNVPNHQWLIELLNTRDRHASTAEHWAAGEGHLECLKLLIETQRTVAASSPQDLKADQLVSRKVRRRDGKTALHYACRNGRLECARYLIDECNFTVDEKSGDGTTPFHLACFGVHMDVAMLLENRGADLCLQNDWGCSAAHWIAMSRINAIHTASSDDEAAAQEKVSKICRYLQKHGLDFSQPQKQGHSPLHKAAQNKNLFLIEWMSKSSEQGGAGLSPKQKEVAGSVDSGGHKPSEILESVGGDTCFIRWMKDAEGW